MSTKIAVKAGRLFTMTEMGTLKPGVMIIEDGRIKKVGKSLDIPDSCSILDYLDTTVIPGLVDAHTHVGIHEEGEGVEGRDTNELTDPVTPQVRSIDGVNPLDLGFQDAVKAGVTALNVGPGSGNVIGGQFAAFKAAGSPILDHLIIKEPSAMKMATGENPKRVYSEKDKMPSTRIGTAAVLREALYDAQNYLRKLEKDKETDRDFKKEALIPVLKGELRAKIHAHRADDIVTAVRISQEFGLKYSIDHCTEGHKIVKFLADRGVEAVVGPGLTARSKREIIERTFKTPSILTEAGVKVAITTDSPVVPIQYLPLMAAFAVREGMDEYEALKSITINAAQIADIDERVGSLQEGRDADFVALDGHPFDLKCQVLDVFIEGKKVNLNEFPKLSQPSTF